MKFENVEYIILILIMVLSFVIFILSFVQICSSSNYGYIEVPLDLFINEKKFARNKTIINLILSLLTLLYGSSRLDKKACNMGMLFSCFILYGSNLSSLIITSISVNNFKKIDQNLIPIDNYEWVVKIDYAIISFIATNFILILVFSKFSFEKDIKSDLCCGSDLLFFISNIFYEIFECNICEKRVDKAKIQQMQNQINSLDNRHEILSNSVFNLNMKKEELKEAKQKEEDEYKELQEKNQELQKDYIKLEAEHKDINNDITRLNNLKKQLEQKRRDLEIEKDNIQSQIFYLTNDISAIEEINNNMTKNSNNLNLNKTNDSNVNERKKENMITIKLVGSTNTEMLCFNDEIFYEVEKRFYQMPGNKELANQNLMLLSGGGVVNRFITIKENKIKEGEGIAIHILDDED